MTTTVVRFRARDVVDVKRDEHLKNVRQISRRCASPAASVRNTAAFLAEVMSSAVQPLLDSSVFEIVGATPARPAQRTVSEEF